VPSSPDTPAPLPLELASLPAEQLLFCLDKYAISITFWFCNKTKIMKNYAASGALITDRYTMTGL
jgi:hypothetical protein